MERPDIRERLIVTPLLDPDKQLGPGAIDLRLGTLFSETVRHQQESIDPLAEPLNPAIGSTGTYVPLGSKFIIHPGQFVLGHTLEFVSLPPDLIGQVLTRSSWGRLGLFVATAVIVHPGYRGILTLELVNTGNVPILMRPGLRIAQLQLWQSSQPTTVRYRSSGKYSKDLGPQSQRLILEADEKEKLQKIGEHFHRRRD